MATRGRTHHLRTNLMEAKWGRPSGDVCQQNPLSRMSPGLMKVDKAHASDVYRVSLSHSMSLTSAPGQACVPTAWNTAAQGEKRRHSPSAAVTDCQRFEACTTSLYLPKFRRVVKPRWPRWRWVDPTSGGEGLPGRWTAVFSLCALSGGQKESKVRGAPAGH